MSWLTDAFKSPPNPADKAMPYLDQLPDELKQYLGKYMGYGDSAYNTLNPLLSQMTTDPTAYLNNIMQGYEPSKDYQLKLGEMQKAAGNTAAAGGMRGSLDDITNEAKLSDRLMGDDMQQWLKNVMGIQGEGMQGLGHMFDTGFDASKLFSDDLSNIRGSQAQLAFQGQREENANRNSMLGALLGGAGTIAGGIFGGPIGAAIGGGIGGMFGPSGGNGAGVGKNFPDFNQAPSGWM